MLASSYPRAEGDTASIFLRYLAQSLARRGLDVTVLAPAEGEGGVSVEEGIRVHRVRYFPAKWQKLAYGSGIMPNLRRNPCLWLEVPFFVAAMSAALLRLARSERPDLVHAHWLLPQGLIALPAKYVFGIPVISSAHGTDAFALQGHASRILKRLVVTKSDAWTSNTAATSAAAAGNGSVSMPSIIPMGVDVAKFSRGDGAGLRRGFGEEELVLLFVGRLVESKGCRDLLRAYAMLSPALRARTRLWFVGEGDQRTALERHAAELPEAARVRFWGAIDHGRLPDFYAAADLVAVPSRDIEGQSVVLLEAFAAACCVVAARTGGIGFVVEDNHSGRLVDAGDPGRLAHAIDMLLADGALRARLAANARRQAEEYDWDKIAARFEELYRHTIAR
ncbi:MAG TPA: glycosyltransferase [Candidatus Binatia bacterium]|jgi:glycosyltransferase involved in cell wall biosynthesis